MNRIKMMDRRDPTKNLARVLKDKYDYSVRVSTSPESRYAEDADVVVNGYDSENGFPNELLRYNDGSRIFINPGDMKRIRSGNDLMKLAERIDGDIKERRLEGAA